MRFLCVETGLNPKNHVFNVTIGWSMRNMRVSALKWYTVPTNYYIKHMVFRNHSTASTHKNHIT
jgi:hypothetical protein